MNKELLGIVPVYDEDHTVQSLQTLNGVRVWSIWHLRRDELAYRNWIWKHADQDQTVDEPKLIFSARDRDLVPDAEAAIRIAEAVWIPIWGIETVNRQRPFHAFPIDNKWKVEGEPGPEGLILVAWIFISNAEIERVYQRHWVDLAKTGTD